MTRPLAAVLIVAVAALVWVGPSLLATNLAALHLRNHLLMGAAAPATFWGDSRIRPDLRLRWQMATPGAQWPADADVPTASGHAYAAAVAAHAWVPAAMMLDALDDRSLVWRTRVPAPSSAAAAVLQRAAEVLAERDPVRAARLAQRARRALHGQPVLPDSGWLRAVSGATHPVAAEAESLRAALDAGTMRSIANPNFQMWSPPGAVVPGWTAGQADVVATVEAIDGHRALRLCTSPGREVLLTNDGFRAEPGTTYEISTTVRGAGGALVSAQVGVRFFDAVKSMTTGVYAWSGPAPSSWSSVSAIWTAGETASSARVVIALAPVGSGCFEVAVVNVRG